jgi:hypothetical protein
MPPWVEHALARALLLESKAKHVHDATVNCTMDEEDEHQALCCGNGGSGRYALAAQRGAVEFQFFTETNNPLY